MKLTFEARGSRSVKSAFLPLGVAEVDGCSGWQRTFRTTPYVDGFEPGTGVLVNENLLEAMKQVPDRASAECEAMFLQNGFDVPE
jgi:hypothetical protein